jgi:hypothetical protein
MRKSSLPECLYGVPDRGEIHVKARRRESLRVRVREGKPGFRCRWCGNRGGLCPGGDRHAREHAMGSAQMGRRGRQRCPCGSHGQGCGVAAASAGEAVTNLLGPGGPDASGTAHRSAVGGVHRAGHRFQQSRRGSRTGKWRATACVSPTCRARADQPVYDEYVAELAETKPEDLAVCAVSIIGPRTKVGKLVTRLDLLIRPLPWRSPRSAEVSGVARVPPADVQPEFGDRVRAAVVDFFRVCTTLSRPATQLRLLGGLFLQ